VSVVDDKWVRRADVTAEVDKYIAERHGDFDALTKRINEESYNTPLWGCLFENRRLIGPAIGALQNIAARILNNVVWHDFAAQQAVIKAAMRVVDCAEEVSTPDPDGPCVFEVGVLLMLELRSAIARYRAALAALDGEPK
jgi:hypothetical protein